MPKEKRDRVDVSQVRITALIIIIVSASALNEAPTLLPCILLWQNWSPALLSVQWEGAMHDLCTRPEPPEPLQNFSPVTASSAGEPEPPAGPEHPEPEKPEKETGTSNTVNMANLGRSTMTNGNGSMLGKRHHSLYEDFNNHEAQGFRKVSWNECKSSVQCYTNENSAGCLA